MSISTYPATREGLTGKGYHERLRLLTTLPKVSTAVFPRLTLRKDGSDADDSTVQICAAPSRVIAKE
ncbi:hypothetical protein EMIT053CA3_130037 [Pseudomonas donghuensis]